MLRINYFSKLSQPLMPVEIILNVRNKDDVEIKFNEKENTSSLEKKSMESQTSL